MNVEAKKNTCNTRKHINKNITISINNKWGCKCISMFRNLQFIDIFVSEMENGKLLSFYEKQSLELSSK